MKLDVFNRRKGHIYRTWFFLGSVFRKKCQTDEFKSTSSPLSVISSLCFKKVNKVDLFSSFRFGVPMWRVSSELFNNP